MDFTENVTHLAIEVPTSWKTAIYIIVCFSITLFLLYEWILWRYLTISKRGKFWFTVLFACTFGTTLITIFLENFFE